MVENFPELWGKIREKITDKVLSDFVLCDSTFLVAFFDDNNNVNVITREEDIDDSQEEKEIAVVPSPGWGNMDIGVFTDDWLEKKHEDKYLVVKALGDLREGDIVDAKKAVEVAISCKDFADLKDELTSMLFDYWTLGL